MVVVAFGLVSMRKRRRWTVTRSVVRTGSASDICAALASTRKRKAQNPMSTGRRPWGDHLRGVRPSTEGGNRCL
jgi:hypothetical protein